MGDEARAGTEVSERRSNISDRPKFSAAEAWEVARPLAFALEQVCERVEIAGSLRRKKSDVGDIELLFIPKIGLRAKDFFVSEHFSLADELIDGWLKEGLIAKRPNVRGIFTWGPENKLAVHVKSGIPVDLFATTQEKWWNSLVCRTGGKQNNLLVTKRAQEIGYSFEAYGTGFKNLVGGPHHETTSERDVFEFLGMPYKEPQDRL